MKSDKKKPARAAAPDTAKSAVISALHPATGTKPADAGKPSAKTGGKGGSSQKGR